METVVAVAGVPVVCQIFREGVSLARKTGQIVRRGQRQWLVRVYLGRDRETRKRRYHNRVERQNLTRGWLCAGPAIPTGTPARRALSRAWQLRFEFSSPRQMRGPKRGCYGPHSWESSLLVDPGAKVFSGKRGTRKKREGGKKRRTYSRCARWSSIKR
jgi:hypothetical protein